MKSLFGSHIELTSRVLDMQLQRQNMINGNIANIKTEGYRPRKVEFEKELQSALGLDVRGKMSRTQEGHMPSVFDANTFSANAEKAFKPRIIYGEDRVSIDKEMAEMAKTQLQYSALSQVIRSNFEGLKTVIAEGQK
ncbi:flagellar basal body rod protein FlgB [Desulfovibrio cuneatus]|uniref:flagellar basal body rod protein FlgB n=1 Tax=Desulfovibrio cuneatus TaxID=159728 RepID=UPI00041E4762|nr:flagellar basal body rod protein FlgB [Desulfovibrio cuneatus]